jgi:flagellar biosynthesis protein FlhF
LNLKRFTARTSREALALVRQTFGEDAVVMSTRPCAEGVEVLAMAPESVLEIERVGRHTATQPPRKRPAASPPSAAADTSKDVLIPASVRARQPGRGPAVRMEPAGLSPTAAEVEADVAQIAMSTLSFQDYVRERMLKRRQMELGQAGPPAAAAQEHSSAAHSSARKVSSLRQRVMAREQPAVRDDEPLPDVPQAAAPRVVPVLRDEIALPALAPRAAARANAAATSGMPALSDLAPRAAPDEMMSELKRMRGLIDQRFGALAFMEKLGREPREAQLTTQLLQAGFSPQLIRRLAQSLPADSDAMAWAAGVLERNLHAGEALPAIEDQGGVYALVGTTGVGKTTSTAKLAAAFAAKHGAAQLGLITLDAYRIGAHEQLRQYGRILGVPVHTAHDRSSLEDLLELLAGKKMVLIDTAGTAQRDTRTRELLDMLGHGSVKRLLVMNAAAQGETFEDVVGGYNAAACAGVVLSKIDEAVKLGPALDVLIRHRLKVLAVANGQRVPEDWHRLSSNALVARALRCQAPPAWRFDSSEVKLVFAGVPVPPSALVRAPASAGLAL